MIKALDFEAKGFVGQIIGPVFLICTIFLAAKAVPIINYDLVLIAIVGLIACAKWHLRGFAMALSILALSIGAKHLFLTDHHLWQAGFEGSVALSLLISGLVFHHNASFVDGLKAQNMAQTQTIEYLEDDLIKAKENAAAEVTISLEKLSEMQLQLDEALTESSSYQMLNDVLRKSSAKMLADKEAIRVQLLQSNRKEGQLLAEVDSLQTELSRIANESFVVQQNSQLFRDLNEARVKDAQTQLVNETLVRLHRNENDKVRDLETRQEELLNDLLKTQAELDTASLQLDQYAKIVIEQTSKIQSLEVYEMQLEEAKSQRDLFQEKAQSLEIVQLQCGALAEKLQVVESELAIKSQQVVITPERETWLLEQIHSLQAERTQVVERAESLQTRVDQYTQMELLYRQLRTNFDEKKVILHKTRSELFHVDTELQTLKQELHQKSLESDPIPIEIAEEIDLIEKENRSLLEENLTLHDLVGHLMKPLSLADSIHQLNDVPVKKKVKTKVQAFQQDLFSLDGSQ